MDRSNVESSKLFSVNGMVVVITGGHTGIGLMMTKAFANNGAAKVYIVGRRKEVLEQAAKEASPHGNVIPIVADVTSKEQLVQAAEQVKREAGHVNLLICNSGTLTPGAKVPPGLNTPLDDFVDSFMQTKVEDWHGKETDPLYTNFAVNVTAVAFTAFAFLKLLAAGNAAGASSSPGRSSQILVTTSIAGFLRNPVGFGPYPMSKAATNHVVKGLASSLATYGVRVNGLAPGLFPSDLAGPIIQGQVLKEGRAHGDDEAYSVDVIPAGRLGATSDMAGTVLYLASPAAAYMNGNIMVVDGGRLTTTLSTY